MTSFATLLRFDSTLITMKPTSHAQKFFCSSRSYLTSSARYVVHFDRFNVFITMNPGYARAQGQLR